MKKNKSQVSNVVAFRSIIIIIDRFPSSFLSDRKRRKKNAIDHSLSARVLDRCYSHYHSMYIESFDRVWWMQTDIWSYACLLMFMSFEGSSKRREKTSQWINCINRRFFNCHLLDHIDHYPFHQLERARRNGQTLIGIDWFRIERSNWD